MSRKFIFTPQLRMGFRAHSKPNPETMCIIPCSFLDKEQSVPSSLSWDRLESQSCSLSFSSSSRSQLTVSDDFPVPTRRVSIIWLHESSPSFCSVERLLPDSVLSSFLDEAEWSISANRTSNSRSSGLLPSSVSNELQRVQLVVLFRNSNSLTSLQGTLFPEVMHNLTFPRRLDGASQLITPS